MLKYLAIIALVFVAACTEEPPPRSVQEFVDNSILLEAAMVRCAENRRETRYEAECVNAREAVKILAAREEDAKRQAFEAESEKKRRALRRAQEAAASARKRAEEQQRLRQEAEYLAQFGQLPSDNTVATEGDGTSGNAPMAVIPETTENLVPNEPQLTPIETADDEAPPANVVGSNAPGITTEPEESSELESVREELQRRNDPPGT